MKEISRAKRLEVAHHYLLGCRIDMRIDRRHILIRQRVKRATFGKEKIPVAVAVLRRLADSIQNGVTILRANLVDPYDLPVVKTQRLAGLQRVFDPG